MLTERKKVIARQGSLRYLPPGCCDRLLSRLRLAKGGLCLMLGVSTAFGFLLASPGLSPGLVAVSAGVTLLAGGAATLNSLQEWRRDALIRRTAGRPLPRGELRPGQALGQSLALIAAGLLLLALSSGPQPFVAGLLALLLYNGVYTPLKERTLLAIVPGALCGSLPPVIGWLAGGGPLQSPTVLLIMLLLVLWQIPHSWLVMLMYRDDDHARRMPDNMLHYLSESVLRRLLVPWVAALAAAMALFCLPPVNPSGLIRTTLLLPTAILPVLFFVQTFFAFFRNDRVLFISLNAIFFFNMLVICGARISLASSAGS